jgi:outer membrane protein assembly factor BamB
MINNIRNWDTLHGYKFRRCGSHEAGIPKKDPEWCFNVPGGMSVGHIVCYQDVGYLHTDNHHIVALNLNSGEVIWSIKAPEGLRGCLAMNVSKDYLVVEQCVFDVHTGDLLIDYFDACEGAFLTGMVLEIVGDLIIKSLDPSKRKEDKILIDVVNKNIDFVKFGFSAFNLIENNTSVVGIENISGVFYLTCKTYPGLDEKWSVELGLPARIIPINGLLFALGEGGFACYRADSGQKVWRKTLGEISDKYKEKYMRSAQFIACEDTITTVTGNDVGGTLFVTIKADTGELAWVKEAADRALNCCAAGDLVFGVYRNYTVFALDRYTGEEVWSLEGGRNWHTVKSQGNKILFTCPGGEVVCYTWDELYQSPGRQKLLNG